jgi:glycogen debranching enzyme
MAVTGQVPFERYYGSVDSTPLFVLLAGAYFKRTGDLALVKDLWPAIEAALHWIDKFGDADGDGFVEYSRQSSEGLVQQGWKDSHDSIFHANGEFAPAPIALCEVQGYVYAAKRAAASMAKALELGNHADRLEREAQTLRERFRIAFWCNDLASYGLALDGEKKLCRVKTSNAGHALFCGIASAEHAEALASSLFADHIFSGWGIRTVSAMEVRYNPISYHNGSVWPHDNSLIGKGLAKYGYAEGAARLLHSLYDASLYMDSYRTPELFCGFHRRGHEDRPTLYPVACSPQAWSAGSVYLLLEACLGLEIKASKREIRFRHACLPANLDWVHVRNLAVSQSVVDLELRREGDSVTVEVNQRGEALTVVKPSAVKSD